MAIKNNSDAKRVINDDPNQFSGIELEEKNSNIWELVISKLESAKASLWLPIFAVFIILVSHDEIVVKEPWVLALTIIAILLYGCIWLWRNSE